jgi:hypothetical protein
MDPRIRIRIHTKMSCIRNTATNGAMIFIHLTEGSEEESEGPSHEQPKDLASFTKDAASRKDANVANDQSFTKEAIFSSTDASFAPSDAFHNGHEPDLPRSRYCRIKRLPHEISCL